jgi:Tfp pilus assembly major pilin PilA
MNSQDFHRIMSRYKHEITQKYTDTINEKSLLSTLESSLEWSNYTDEEKHISHKVVLSVAKKTNNFKQFEFQILLIDIYDLLISVKDTFLDQQNNDTVFRLLSIIDICKFYKSEYRDLSQVNIYPFKVLSEYVKNNAEHDLLMKIEPVLKELRSKIDLALRFS